MATRLTTPVPLFTLLIELSYHILNYICSEINSAARKTLAVMRAACALKKLMRPVQLMEENSMKALLTYRDGTVFLVLLAWIIIERNQNDAERRKTNLYTA